MADADGMSIIDGRTGAPLANKFFSERMSTHVTGDDGVRSARAMAEDAECIVITISAESTEQITILRGHGTGVLPEEASYYLNLQDIVIEKFCEIMRARDETIYQRVNDLQQSHAKLARDYETLQDRVDKMKQLEPQKPGVAAPAVEVRPSRSQRWEWDPRRWRSCAPCPRAQSTGGRVRAATSTLRSRHTGQRRGCCAR